MSTTVQHTIAFLLPANPYLPELKAYEKYFSAKGYRVVRVKNKKELVALNYDVEWHFMGADSVPRKAGVIKVHEFGSLSTAPFARVKDIFKKTVSQKPDIRIFLNENVKQVLAFKDHVPAVIRDMGVSAALLKTAAAPVKKKFDFCYLGNMHPARKVENFLRFFKDRMRDSGIVMIGQPTDYLLQQFGGCSNITFTGMLDYDKVGELMTLCEYAINYVPDIHPYNIQTSTKLLDYCACGLKIITNEYGWVKNFEKERNASFFFLRDDFENFFMERIRKHHFVTPNVDDCEWETLIERSGLPVLIAELLEKRM